MIARANPSSGISWVEKQDFNWIAAVTPPDCSTYHGGIFVVRINFPRDYPFRPPRITFSTDMFHPCVYCDVNRNVERRDDGQFVGHVGDEMLFDKSMEVPCKMESWIYSLSRCCSLSYMIMLTEIVDVHAPLSRVSSVGIANRI